MAAGNSMSSAADAPERVPASVDSDIRRDVTDAIFDLRMPPGMRLSEATLGELYGVSRTVARKALFHLVRDGLVEMRPNRGAIVVTPSVQEVHEVFEARRIIETALVGRSMLTMVAKNCRLLHKLAKADAVAHDANDRRSMIRTSGNFHRELARMAGNVVLQQFLDRLIGRTSLIIATYQPSAARACSSHDHEKLAELVEQGNVARAQAAMRRHLCECEDDLCLTDAPARPPLARILGRRGAEP